VVPLPKDWRAGRGTSSEGKTVNFYGDLSFPNVKDGDDAKSFLDNLDNLTKD